MNAASRKPRESGTRQSYLRAWLMCKVHQAQSCGMADSNQVLGMAVFPGLFPKDFTPCRSALILGRNTPVIIPCGLHLTGSPTSISPAFATMSRYTLPPLIDSPRGLGPMGSQRTKASAFSCIHLERWTRLRLSPRKSTELFPGLRSNYVGPPEGTFRNCKFAWFVFPATRLTARFRERHGWMTSRWFPKPRSIPNHEVASLWHLRSGRVCCCRSWRRRRLGSGCV